MAQPHTNKIPAQRKDRKGIYGGSTTAEFTLEKPAGEFTSEFSFEFPGGGPLRPSRINIVINFIYSDLYSSLYKREGDKP